jgi:hypothetical protein
MKCGLALQNALSIHILQVASAAVFQQQGVV